MVASNVSPDHGILIAGLPGYPIEDVVLSNILVQYRGGGTAEQAARLVPEHEKSYPEPYVFGVMPSWGIFARHVANLQLRGLELRVNSPDQRPAVRLQDAVGVRALDVQLSGATAQPLWSLNDVSELRVRDCTGLDDSAGMRAEPGRAGVSSGRTQPPSK
jgi:hypothetical protein